MAVMVHRDAEAAAGGMLTRAALLRFVAVAFAYPAPGHWAAVRREFAALGRGTGMRDMPAGLRRAFKRAQLAWQGAEAGSLAPDYLRLFAPNGAASLHESAYGDGRRIAGRAAELADISGFYLAFGFAPSAGDPDLPDHLCSELEFVSGLRVKQAYAWNQGWKTSYRRAREAEEVFLDEHLGRWVKALRANLAEIAVASPYFELADLAVAAVDAECRDLGITPQTTRGRTPHDFMQADEFDCPLAQAAPPAV
jgi:TorA maturation chaperone TorD